jgi:hypothetical protein
MTSQSLYERFLNCREEMNARFSRADLIDLCWSIGASQDDLPFNSPKELATELLRWAERRGKDKRRELLDLLRRERPPDSLWPDDYSSVLDKLSGSARSISVPVVVIAMSREQAERLIQDPEQSAGRSTIISNFQAYAGFQSTDWIEHYDQEPDDWKPFYRSLPKARSIREIIIDVIDYFNAHEKLNEGLVLEPRFMTSDFLDRDQRSRAVESLENRRGVLIIDPLSLQHPVIMDMLLSSGVLGSPTVSAIVINPLDQSPLDVHAAVQSLIQAKLQRFYDRFSQHLDLECEYGGEDIINLRRWLLFRLSRLREEARILPSTRQSFLKQAGIEENLEGSQIGEYIRRQRR